MPALCNQMSQSDIDQLILNLMHKFNITSVGYAVIKDFSFLYHGTVSTCASLIVDEASIFQACSLSKSLTAYAVMKLVNEGRIDLDASINSQLTSWKIPGSASGQITVRNALSMTSGLGYGEIGSTFPGYKLDAKIPTLLDILNGVKPANNSPIQINFSPGTTYFYSGAGYMVIQQLIEDVVGYSFINYMNKTILPLLGMTNSCFSCPLSVDERIKALPGTDSKSHPIPNGWENIVTSASGGLWSTPSDLASLLINMASQTFSQEIFRRNPNTKFGLGVVLDGQDHTFNIRKNGHNVGYHCEMLLFPDLGDGIVVMTNHAEGMELIVELVRFFANKLSWPHYSENFNEL